MGDFNGDGIMDFAVADFLSDNVLVISGDAEGHFRLSAKLPSGSGPRAIVAADFNHDGVMDLATADFFSGTVSIFLGRRDGTFEEPRLIQLDKGLASIVSADFDADGIPDLAVANFFSGQVVILKGVGDGTFEVRSRLGPIGAISFLYSVGRNNRGLSDLVAFDASGEKAWLIAGERGGFFKSAASVDPKVAVALISTQEPTNEIPPTGQLRRLTKVAGDGQSAPVGSLLTQHLVVEIGEQGGRLLAGEKVSFSNLYGNAQFSDSRAKKSDESGRAAAAAISLGPLPGNVIVAANVHGGPATVFGVVSTLSIQKFFNQVSAALAQWSTDSASITEPRSLLNDAEQRLKSGDEVGAVVKLTASLESQRMRVTSPSQGPASTTDETKTNEANLTRRLINQILLFGPNAPDTTGTISCGQVVSGNITSPGQVDSYTFNGNAGQAIRFAALATSGNLCAVAALYNPSGAVVTAEDCNGSTGSIGLSTTGTYTIKVYDHSLTNTGTYNLSLQFTTGDCSAGTSCGQLPSGSISAVAQFNAYSFSASAGQAIRFAALATSGNLCAVAALYNPSGAVVTAEDCNGSTGSIGISTTGKYTILVYDHSLTNTGSYNLSLQFTTGDCSTGTSCGQLPSGSIAAVAQFNAYSFSASAGQAIRFAALATSGNLCAVAALYNPSGAVVTAEDCNGSTGSIGISTTGKYTILVYDHSLRNTGTYNLSLQFTTGNCSTGTSCGKLPSGSIAAVAQFNAYSFSARAGQAIRFAALATSGNLCAVAALYNPSGTVVTAEDCNGSTGSIGISTTGKYTILVYDHSLTNTGTYNLSLQSTTGNCARSLPCGLPGASGNITKRAELDAYSFNAIAGQAAIISAQSTAGSLCAVAALYSPSGSVVGAEDCNGSTGSIGLPTTGKYTILVYDHSLSNAGTYNVKWQFTTGCPVCTTQPTSLTFPTQLVGTSSTSKAVTVTNTGAATMSITGISLKGANGTDFRQTHTCGASLAVNAQCTINVNFKPTASGTRSASVSIADNAAPPNPQTVALAGTGTVVELVPTSLSFGNQSVGTTSAAQTVTMTNVGSSTLTISGISLTGTNAGDFSQTHTCGGTLGAGASCTISVTFHPSATGARSAAVSISDDGGGSPQTVPLSGTGT
ncbi:MAG TPA: choice-of-anchor D domain-containing protein [Terriglobales bacterium]